MSALKRILNKDIKSIKNNNLNDLGIYVEFNEENLFEAKALIKGPKGSLYEGGFLFFSIEFPKNYPYFPPDVSYVSCNKVRIHPNLYVGGNKNGLGKVCLSILGTWNGPKWTSIMDISTVLITIQSLLDNDPLNHEPGFNNKNNLKMHENYNEIIFYETINSLCIQNLITTPEKFICFKGIMIQEFKLIQNDLLLKLQKKIEENDKSIKISIPYYRINLIINYKNLYNKLKSIEFIES